MVIADHLALFANAVFAAPDKFNRYTLLWGALAFSGQILADFSGYTDIGRGCARLLGFHLPENFLSPLLSRTPRELWHRWHITLGRWMRDYLYFPLSRQLRAKNRLIGPAAAAVITFFVVGAWHGANWTFVLWGIYLGIVVLIEVLLARSAAGQIWERFTPKFLRNGILIILTYSTTLIGLTLFRSASLDGFLSYLHSFYTGGNKTAFVDTSVYEMYFAMLCMEILFFYSIKEKRWVFLGPMQEMFGRAIAKRPNLALILYGLAGTFVGTTLVLSVLFRAQGSFSTFLYFQF
jgi:D-alanyl-lipoteichoic acid acyltransferase DltB (MBOAT superfamily)